MNYKLIGDNDIDHVKECFLHNRGIEDTDRYCHLTEGCVNDYTNLNHIQEAVALYLQHVNNSNKITILVDCDCDGFTSAAMLYNYTKQMAEEVDITYLLHSGKQHGLSPDIVIPEDTQLLLIPDAGTNDVEQCKVLKNNGIDIIILDHHIQEQDNPFAVVVNNQSSERYFNKDLCGAGVVYQFLRAVDEEIWEDKADNYLDLCSIGNIADVMDMRSHETKYLVEKGLKRIVNPGLEAFIDGQSFQIKGHLNIRAVEWNISPLINAVCRVGTQEDKEILFKALIGDERETYIGKKRDKETKKYYEVEESVYEHAFRLASNAKTRQDNAVKKILPEVTDWIENHNAQDKPIIFARVDSEIDGSFTGLLAIKLANKYKKPTLILRHHHKCCFTGSGRNFDNSPLESFKDLLDNSKQFNFVQGHHNAFGVNIDVDHIPSAIDYCIEQCKGVDFSMVTVDFDLNYSDLDIAFIRDVDAIKDFFGTGIKEPLVHISNVTLHKEQGEILGKTGGTWKFTDDNDIVFIKFGNTTSDKVMRFLNQDDEDEILIRDMICKVGISEFKGILSPQVQVISYEV